MKQATIVITGALALIVSASLAEQSDTTTSGLDAETAQSSGIALENWEKVYEVLSHPRCANCHVPEDNRPRWSGPSFGFSSTQWMYHGMNINGGASRDGSDSIPCSACHGSTNSNLEHGPPGAPHWGLAPVEMNWWQKSSQEVCEQIKDPDRNGGRTLIEVADHIGHDPLVLWGWEPGPGREPAPYSAKETAEYFMKWIEAGEVCPAS